MSTIVTVSDPLFRTQAVFGEQNLDPLRIIGL